MKNITIIKVLLILMILSQPMCILDLPYQLAELEEVQGTGSGKQIEKVTVTTYR